MTPELTPRELAVLVALSTGRSWSEAAALLGISYSNVHKRLDSVYRKCDTGGLVETYHRLRWLRVP